MQTTAVSNTTEEQALIVDVWSRTERRYRVRSVLMLLLLALLFAGLCCFMFWLRTGAYFPWGYEDYVNLLSRSLSPAGIEQVTLSNFLSSPIPVREVPIHAVIMGLQFAAMSSIPILVAILYRLPFSVIFAAMVVFLAAMPWLGMTVMLGCALASMGRFRFTFRYASTLIGLIPVVIYFVMASWVPSDASTEMVEHEALLYAPWVLALLSSCVICAVALALAKLINYRPGGIPPVLAMLFATPVFLFHSQVGRDELEYRLVKREIGPSGTLISASADISTLASKLASQHWSRAEGGSYDEIYDRMLLVQKNRILEETAENRQRAILHCDAFIERFSQSRYVPNVLFLKARAQDCRLDRGEFERAHRVVFRFDLPNGTSRRTWQILVERFPDSDLRATGLYKLAILKARDGDLDGAVASLEMLMDQFDPSRSSSKTMTQSDNIVGSVFQRSPPSSSMSIDPSQSVRDARRLKEMLVACRNDQPKPISALFGPRQDGSDVLVHPIQVLMWFDSVDPNYETNLEALAQSFKNSETAGYVEERLAMMEHVITRRIERFQKVAEALAGRPSGAKAQFHLADALQEHSRLMEAKESFETLIQRYPESCWSTEAQERLDALSILQEAMG
ncbi:MAG: tetratricopeptide repeat protein [Phycisphaerales bacterium]|nr:tetratricopeptide repeat protein [Phycisphaerales bacterium]